MGIPSGRWKAKKPAPKYPLITKELLQAERAAGKTVKQIAEDHNAPIGTISTLLQQHKISKKRT